MSTFWKQIGAAAPEEEPVEKEDFWTQIEKPAKKDLTTEKKVAESFKFFGYEPTPERIEAIRRPMGIATKEYVSGMLGVPGDVLTLIQRLARIEDPKEIIPGARTIGSLIERLAGEEFRPETKAEELLERGAGLAGALTSPFLGQIQPFRALLAAGLGVGAEELTERMGAPKGVQTAASLVATLLPYLTRRGAPPPTRAAEIARREAIEAPAAAIPERIPRKALKVARPTRLVAKREETFRKSIEKAKDRILESVTPIAKTEKQAAEISKTAGKLFENAEKAAERIKGAVPTPNISASLNKSINRLRKTPALSSEEKSTLKFLEEIQTGLETKNTTSNLMAFNKSLNKEIDFLKPTGADKMLLDVKDALMKDLNAVGKGNPTFYKDWKKANALYTEFKKFNKIRTTLGPIFKEDAIDYKKFQNLFTDVKKQKELTKLFGKDQYNRLKDISKLSQKGSEVFKQIEKDPKLLQQIDRWTNFAIIGAVLLKRPIAIGTLVAEKIGMKAARGYLGRLFTDPNYSKHYLNFLKAIKIGSKKGVLTTARKVSEDVDRAKKDVKD